MRIMIILILLLIMKMMNLIALIVMDYVQMEIKMEYFKLKLLQWVQIFHVCHIVFILVQKLFQRKIDIHRIFIIYFIIYRYISDNEYLQKYSELREFHDFMVLNPYRAVIMTSLDFHFRHNVFMMCTKQVLIIFYTYY